MKRVYVLLVLALTLLVPVRANASPVDSFANGFETLVNPQVTVPEERPEQEFIDSYEPELREPETVRAEDDSDVDLLLKIKQFVANLKFEFDGTTYYIWVYTTPRKFLIEFVVPVAVGLVFFWWGLRKSKSIIWTAFRSGRLNLGTSVKRAWYRRKAKEWYG